MYKIIVKSSNRLGASHSQLIDALQKQLLSVLWLGVPAWFCMLTQQEKQDIDRAAKVGLRIVFGEAYSGFENTLRLCCRYVEAYNATFKNYF